MKNELKPKKFFKKQNIFIAVIAVFLVVGIVITIVVSKKGGNGDSQTSSSETANTSESIELSESFNRNESDSDNDNDNQSESENSSMSEQESLSVSERESGNEQDSERESESNSDSSAVSERESEQESQRTSERESERESIGESSPATSERESWDTSERESEQESLSSSESESEQTSEEHTHSFDKMIEEERYFASAATCTQKARYYYSCECGEIGDTTFEVGKLAEHTPVTDKGYAATCDNDGLTDGAHCSVCGSVITAQEIIPAVGHNYKSGICSVCDDVELTDNKYFTFTLLSDGGYSIGASSELKNSTLNGVRFPTVYNDQPVVSVAVDGFDGCQFTKLIVPEGIISLGVSSFGNCNKLVSVSLPDSLTEVSAGAFKNCLSLKNIVIPNNVEYIGIETFIGCSSLESLTIPFVGDRKNAIATDSDIYSFGYIFGTAEYENSYYVSQHYKYNNSYRSNVFYLPLSLKNVTVTGGEILDYAFEGCTGLKKIDIPQNITEIRTYAFYACGIETFKIPSTVTKIEDYTFSYCNNLTSVIIPNSVINIGYEAFSHCSDSLYTKTDGIIYVDNWVVGVEDKGITFARIKENAEGIAGASFFNCNSLTDVTIPSGVRGIGNQAFRACSSLTNVKIPNGVTSIEGYVFDSCSSLVSVSIPDSVTRIEYCAFAGCKFTNITIPDSVIEIGYNAFSYCQELQEIIIPQNVVYIGENAFTDCDNLHIVYWNAINCKYAGNTNDPIFNSRKYVNVWKKIIIGDMVETIPPYTFYLRMYAKGDSASVSVIISDSVKEFGEDAFLGYYGSLYYCGTEEQWAHYNIDWSGFSSMTVYYYSENKPTESNKFWHYDSDGNPVLWG